MTRILREAAEVRDALEQARSRQDQRLAQRQVEACLTLMSARTAAPASATVPHRTPRTLRSSASRGSRP